MGHNSLLRISMVRIATEADSLVPTEVSNHRVITGGSDKKGSSMNQVEGHLPMRTCLYNKNLGIKLEVFNRHPWTGTDL